MMQGMPLFASLHLAMIIWLWPAALFGQIYSQSFPYASPEDDNDLIEGSYPDEEGDHDFSEEDASDGLEPTASEPTASEHTAKLLAPTDEELRAEFDQAYLLGLGNALPWMSLSLQGHYLLEGDVALFFALGFGRAQQDGRLDSSLAYEVQFDVKSVSAAGRYYFPRLPSLAADLVAGYALWEGQVKSQGVPEAEELLDADLITSRFEAHGPTLSTRLVLTSIWEYGLVLEWAIFGVQKSWMLAKDLDKNSADGRTALRENVERAHVYGFTNIAVGYIF